MALEELHDLKELWSELSKIWEQIDQMKEHPWVSVQPRKVPKIRLNLCGVLSLKRFVEYNIYVFVAPSEPRRTSESAEELPGKAEAVCFLRVCAEAA